MRVVAVPHGRCPVPSSASSRFLSVQREEGSGFFRGCEFRAQGGASEGGHLPAASSAAPHPPCVASPPRCALRTHAAPAATQAVSGRVRHERTSCKRGSRTRSPPAPPGGRAPGKCHVPLPSARGLTRALLKALMVFALTVSCRCWGGGRAVAGGGSRRIRRWKHAQLRQVVALPVQRACAASERPDMQSPGAHGP